MWAVAALPGRQYPPVFDSGELAGSNIDAIL
jgi:hypothetical protein